MKLKIKIINRLIIFGLMVATISLSILLLPWNEARAVLQEEQAKIERARNNPFNKITLTSQSAIVMRADTGEIIFKQDEKRQLPLASITKVMTALVASELHEPNTVIYVSNQALVEGSNAGLTTGNWQLKNLIDFSLVTSSNGAAKAIALTSTKLRQADFIAEMNKLAKKIGLETTYFINPTGLDVGGAYGGSYGSAFDIAKLFQYVLKEKPSLLEATRYPTITEKNEDGRIYYGNNTNQIIDQIPGILASKTGFTDNAGGNLAIAFDAGLGEPYIVVVLGSSKEGRFLDVAKLVETTLAYRLIN